MPHPISENLKIGTIGELLVQIRLLQFDVQAAPPIKDSGTDLVAIRDGVYKSLQIKTTTLGRFRTPELGKHCDVLALVDLQGYDREILLDHCTVFLVPRADVDRALRENLRKFVIRAQMVDQIFGAREPHE